MMTYSDDHIALAAEYALGTLDADERALVETMMIVDPGFLEMVEVWDRTLAPLHQMVASAEPPSDLWEKIRSSAFPPKEHSPFTFSPETPAMEAATLDGVPEPVVGERPVPIADGEPEGDRTVVSTPVAASRGGRMFGAFMTAVAACLAAVISLQIYRPDLLPESLRIKPKIQVVEVKTPAPVPAQRVAVLQSNAAEPAFILTVDADAHGYTVRRVGAPLQQNRSYELWIVSGKLGAPRSLGVIDGDKFTMRDALAAYDPAIVNDAIYAVTVESKGGSPTGAPTSQPLWAGKLFESVPARESKP